MLNINPKARLSAQEALSHKWFNMTNCPKVDLKIDKNIMKNLQSFRGKSKLKKAAMNMLVKMADTEAIDGLREEF